MLYQRGILKRFFSFLQGWLNKELRRILEKAKSHHFREEIIQSVLSRKISRYQDFNFMIVKTRAMCCIQFTISVVKAYSWPDFCICSKTSVLEELVSRSEAGLGLVDKVLGKLGRLELCNSWSIPGSDNFKVKFTRLPTLQSTLWTGSVRKCRVGFLVRFSCHNSDPLHQWRTWWNYTNPCSQRKTQNNTIFSL